MTMHLDPRLTTINSRKPKKKKQTKAQKEAHRQHQEFLKRMGADPETIARNNALRDAKKPQKPTVTIDKPQPRKEEDYSSIQGTAPKKPEQVYNGEREYLGAFTMHKSNAVPVFGDRKEDAKEIAKMRRN